MNINDKVISNEVPANVSAISILRLTAIGAGLAIAGFSMQANAACTTGSSVECGNNAISSTSHGVAIGKNANAVGTQSVAIGSTQNDPKSPPGTN